MQKLFPPSSGLAADLASIEKYLNHIIDEYERNFSLFTGQTPTLPLASFGRLKEFIGQIQRNGDFDTNFKGAFHKAVASLEELIIC